ncbi:uncharacterized protein LOC127872108 [Dreissena polymorpha]|uniref:uncharacterized protein LOC127872108 n=1 Tax=Dreissena polymorpha TaxID=45954 RepID=UPI002265104B|nr:uncharacterized protein LOC127872108 [Dreissena polymorpha]
MKMFLVLLVSIMGEDSGLALARAACPPPPAVQNAAFTPVQSSYTDGANVTFTCNTGYGLQGSRIHYCRGSSWEGSLRCYEQFCETMNNPRNGIIVGNPSYKIGTYITFQCNTGYTLKGNSQLLCRDDLKFDRNPPTCDVHMCPDFGVIDHARIRIYHGSFVVVTCEDSYVLVRGKAIVVCQADGTWDRKPVCIPFSCGWFHGMDSNCVKDFVQFESLYYMECKTDLPNTRIGAESYEPNECLETSRKWKYSQFGCFCHCKVMYNKSIVKTENLDTNDYLLHDTDLKWSCKEGCTKNQTNALRCMDGQMEMPSCTCETGDFRNSGIKHDPGEYDSYCKVNSDCQLGFVCIMGTCTCERSFFYDMSSRRCKKVCRGSSDNFMRHGTYDHQYDILKNRYTNCSYVDGNLELYGLEKPFDLGFLKDIEEVDGYVFIVKVFSNYLNLTKLRIIRGKQLFQYNNESYSLYVAQNYNPRNDSQGILELQFLSLSEIVHGKVFFDKNDLLCFVNSIEWTDINPNTLVLFSRQCPPCPPECFNKKTGDYHCWGSGKGMCQKLNYIKVVCSEACDGRCFGDQQNQCCHPECAAGCTGTKKTDCLACKNFNNEGSCEQHCPGMTFYNKTEMRRENNTLGRYAYGSWCVKECPLNLVKDQDSCVLNCTKDKQPDPKTKISEKTPPSGDNTPTIVSVPVSVGLVILIIVLCCCKKRIRDSPCNQRARDRQNIRQTTYNVTINVGQDLVVITNNSNSKIGGLGESSGKTG